MKKQRHELIIRLITDNVVSTQEQLQSLLTEQGCKVTQATVSRDINELALIKTSTAAGVYRYSVPNLSRRKGSPADKSFMAMISDGVVGVDYALNTVAVKCLTGMAQAVCAKLDSAGIENVVGTIAGDDTIFILMRTERDAARLVKELELVINN